MHGKGKLVFPNGGGVYEGYFRYGLKSGMGEYIYGDGSVYKGSFKDDLYEGEGEMDWSNG